MKTPIKKIFITLACLLPLQGLQCNFNSYHEKASFMWWLNDINEKLVKPQNQIDFEYIFINDAPPLTAIKIAAKSNPQKIASILDFFVTQPPANQEQFDSFIKNFVFKLLPKLDPATQKTLLLTKPKSLFEDETFISNLMQMPYKNFEEKVAILAQIINITQHQFTDFNEVPFFINYGQFTYILQSLFKNFTDGSEELKQPTKNKNNFFVAIQKIGSINRSLAEFLLACPAAEKIPNNSWQRGKKIPPKIPPRTTSLYKKK